MIELKALKVYFFLAFNQFRFLFIKSTIHLFISLILLPNLYKNGFNSYSRNLHRGL